jgi:hypothetical protein
MGLAGPHARQGRSSGGRRTAGRTATGAAARVARAGWGVPVATTPVATAMISAAGATVGARHADNDRAARAVAHARLSTRKLVIQVPRPKENPLQVIQRHSGRCRLLATNCSLTFACPHPVDPGCGNTPRRSAS